MATINITAPRPMVMADLKGKVDPDWCPGCGDFGVLAAVQKALVELQIPNHQVATVSGIGCSSNFPGFINTYGMHTLHGRSLPVASGLKLANHELTVLVTGGDGDGFGIGCGHFVHAMRRNINLTYMVLDSAGATFVGRGFSGDQKHLTELIKQAIQHKGFSFLDVFSPCVTYNKDNTFQWFRPRVKKLEDNAEYDATNWVGAMEKATVWGEEIPIGKFYERTDLPTLEETEPVLDAGPLIGRDLHIPPDVAKKFVEELM